MKLPGKFPKLPKMAVPLFSPGTIFLCQTREEWIAAHRALGSTASMLERRGAANTFRGQGVPDIYLLGVFDGAPATAAHEAAHLVFDICAQAGVKVVPGEANETFCHLLDAVVEFATLKMRKPG